jgi:hypothetical protein
VMNLTSGIAARSPIHTLNKKKLFKTANSKRRSLKTILDHTKVQLMFFLP